MYTYFLSRVWFDREQRLSAQEREREKQISGMKRSAADRGEKKWRQKGDERGQNEENTDELNT